MTITTTHHRLLVVVENNENGNLLTQCHFPVCSVEFVYLATVARKQKETKNYRIKHFKQL